MSAAQRSGGGRTAQCRGAARDGHRATHGGVWGEAKARFRKPAGTSDRPACLGAASKVLRFVLSVGVLGVGAYLVIQQQATAGIIIAGSIIVAPWRRWNLRSELARLRRGTPELEAPVRRSRRHGQRVEPMPLPPPKANLVVEMVTAGPPGVHTPRHQDVNFALKAGEGSA